MTFFGGGCTEPNPNFIGDEEGGVRREAGPDLARTDGQAGTDAGSADGPAPPDLFPAPDLTPRQCVDDADCDDGRSCTTDRCGEDSTCAHTLDDGQCLIGGQCVAAGTTPQDNPCQVCDPEQDPRGWSNVRIGEPCTDDGVACTTDACIDGRCEHPLLSGWCLIDGACTEQGATPPGEPCSQCDPETSTSDWTASPDGAPCADDGLWCTADRCESSTCVHPVEEGCLIDGQCRAVGWTDQDECQECVPEADTSDLTFVAGKGCTPQGAGEVGMCLDSGCWAFTEELYEPKLTGPGFDTLMATGFEAVAPVTGANGLWAVGGFRTFSGEGGLIVSINGTGAPAATVQTPHTMRAIHHRLAVGDDGEVWYYDGKKWVEDASLKAGVGKLTRTGVWGAELGKSEVFYLSDYQSYSWPGILRCFGSPGLFTCEGHDSFATGTLVGGVFGTLTSAGTLGPLWAIRVGGDEDIFYNPGSGDTWSTQGPQGCEDNGATTSTPCSNTSGDFADLFGVGPEELWVSGTEGLLMRYDGKGWQRVTASLANPSAVDLGPVFASPDDGLVSVVVTHNAMMGRTHSLVSYNRALDRWLAPIELLRSTTNMDRVNDMGGEGYRDLTLVGVKVATSTAGFPRPMGWILRLTKP